MCYSSTLSRVYRHHHHHLINRSFFSYHLRLFSSTITPSKAGTNAYHKRENNHPTTNINNLKLNTLLAHSGLLTHQQQQQQTFDGNNNALCPPLEVATTYERPASGDYSDGNIYARTHNPTRARLEQTMAQLEVAANQTNDDSDSSSSIELPTCIAFSSGMAAISSILLAHPQCHVILPDDTYHGVPTLLHTIFNQHEIQHSAIDMTNLNNVRSEIRDLLSTRGTKKKKEVILWIETPSNPLCKVTDIRRLCEIAKKENVLSVVDSTWAPPCITQPLLLGADAVVHSATKYLGGHSDVLLGLITTSPSTPKGKHLGPKLKSIQSNLGAVASPFDSWLTLRGLRTLHVRLKHQCQTAMKLAQFLHHHELVQNVHYPGLSNHPQHLVAQQQMSMFGGMLSFEVCSEAMAMAVAGGVKVIKRATSLGGTETLIEHRASIEPEGRVTSPKGLLRVSVGLEDVDDLILDLDEALRVAKEVVVDETR